MALLQQKVEEAEQREEKIKELLSNPDMSPEDKETILEAYEWKPPYEYPEGSGIYTGDMSYTQFEEYKRKLRERYGDNPMTNLSFLEAFVPDEYYQTLMDDMVDLRKSNEYTQSYLYGGSSKPRYGNRTGVRSKYFGRR